MKLQLNDSMKRRIKAIMLDGLLNLMDGSLDEPEMFAATLIALGEEIRSQNQKANRQNSTN